MCKKSLNALDRGCKNKERERDTQTSIRLASHLVRAPNSRSGGHEFESPVRRQLGALTKMERSLGSGLSTLTYVALQISEDASTEPRTVA